MCGHIQNAQRFRANGAPIPIRNDQNKNVFFFNLILSFSLIFLGTFDLATMYLYENSWYHWSTANVTIHSPSSTTLSEINIIPVIPSIQSKLKLDHHCGSRGSCKHFRIYWWLRWSRYSKVHAVVLLIDHCRLCRRLASLSIQPSRRQCACASHTVSRVRLHDRARAILFWWDFSERVHCTDLIAV